MQDGDERTSQERIAMDAAPRPPDAGGPDPAATQAQVQRLLQAGLFAPGSRAHLLLDYLLVHWHRHGAEPVKAYAIALDVLGRGAEFDPGTDSIVRVELGRLRKLLDLYHAGQGAADPVQLRLPRGQSRIEVCLGPPPGAAPPQTGQPTGAGAGRPDRGRRWRGPVLLAGLAVTGLVGLAGAVWTVVPLVHPPRVVVAPTQVSAADPQLAALAEGLALHLASDLAPFRTFQVVLAPQPLPAILNRASYRLESRLEGRIGQADLTLALIRKADAAVILSQTAQIDLTRDNAGSQIATMLGGLVGRIVGPHGALEADGRARLHEIEAMWLGRPPEEFLCLLRYQSYDQTKDETRRAAVRSCLARLTGARSPVGAIWAAQSAMQLLDWSEDPDGAARERLAVALATAHLAQTLDPGGADGPAAMGATLTAMGRFAEAEAVLAEAADLSPNDPEIAIRRAWLRCLRGDWPAGTEAIAAEAAARVAVPGWYRLPLALAAMRAGDAERLSAEADLIVASGDRRGLVLALGAARMRHDAGAEAALARRIADARATPAQLATAIARLFPDPAIAARLGALATP